MSVFFTSDMHIGHERIIELCNRPFKSVEEMDETIVERWNETVGPEDVVWVLGDVAMSPIRDTLKTCSRLNGPKLLIPGNHDRCFSEYRKGGVRISDVEMYQEAGFTVELEFLTVIATTYEAPILPDHLRWWNLCHFPYAGDSQGEDRYAHRRPVDDGLVLLHGHTHSDVRIRGRQIHVGMDAWNFQPVPIEDIVQLLLLEEDNPEGQ